MPVVLVVRACVRACLQTHAYACCDPQWHTADLKNNERYYGFARKEYEKAGRKIIDATPGGKCQVFEKADYLDVLYRKT